MNTEILNLTPKLLHSSHPGEIFLRADQVKRLSIGVRRLRRLTKGVLDDELYRWYCIVARFQKHSVARRAQVKRGDATIFLAAYLDRPKGALAERKKIGRRLSLGNRG
jgi:hypothetical protein